MNPMLAQLTNSNATNNLSKVSELAKRLRAVQNPQAMLNYLVQQNPNAREALEAMNCRGNKSQEQVLLELAQKKGIEPQAVQQAITEAKKMLGQ